MMMMMMISSSKIERHSLSHAMKAPSTSTSRVRVAHRDIHARSIPRRACATNARRGRRGRESEDANARAGEDAPSRRVELDDVDANERDAFDRSMTSASGNARPRVEAIDVGELEAMERRNASGAARAKRAKEEAFALARERARERNANANAFERALSADALLVFGCDGVLPELVNARVAMIGVASGVANELATGKSFPEQFVANATNGTSAAIVLGVIAASCVPSFVANASDGDVYGDLACKWRRDATARGGRGYLVDPLNLDARSLPGVDTVLGRIGVVPFVELLNGRAAMVTLLGILFGELALGRAFFAST